MLTSSAKDSSLPHGDRFVPKRRAVIGARVRNRGGVIHLTMVNITRGCGDQRPCETVLAGRLQSDAPICMLHRRPHYLDTSYIDCLETGLYQRAGLGVCFLSSFSRRGLSSSAKTVSPLSLTAGPSDLQRPACAEPRPSRAALDAGFGKPEPAAGKRVPAGVRRV